MLSLFVLNILLYICPILVSSQAAASVAYTPITAPCPPGTQLTRNAGLYNQSLSPQEATYISARQREVLPDAWASYLDSVYRTVSLPLPSYVYDILGGHYGIEAFPKLGIAVSGGGYSAAMFGAGILNALDSRNPMSVKAGIGGLLQTASYLSGLSGGSWFVGSLAQANFPTIPELVFGPPNADVEGFGGWMTDKDILELGSNANVTQAYVSGLVEEVMGKHAAGFPVTAADVLGRTFSRHFVNGTNASNFLNNKLTHGAGITFSSIVNISSFANHMQPFPILITDISSTRTNSSVMLNASDAFVPLSNPMFELNVFEMGSFDPMLAAFIPMKYLGSSNSTICISNFDQVSFIEATSSDSFNIYDLLMQAPPYPVEVIFDLLAQLLPEPSVPIAQTLIPNPFSGSAYFANSNETYLSLVDGSEDGEMMPIQPLLVKAREVDIIFAIDASGQTDDNFADGSSLIATQDRVSLFPSYYSFPPVPISPSTLASSNLTKHPTFFGCNSNTSAPLVVYFANGGPPLGQLAITNISVHSTSIPIQQAEAMLAQTFDIATQGIPIETPLGMLKDPEWPECLACAVVDRARSRLGRKRHGICERCMLRYCWS